MLLFNHETTSNYYDDVIVFSNVEMLSFGVIVRIKDDKYAHFMSYNDFYYDKEYFLEELSKYDGDTFSDYEIIDDETAIAFNEKYGYWILDSGDWIDSHDDNQPTYFQSYEVYNDRIEFMAKNDECYTFNLSTHQFEDEEKDYSRADYHTNDDDALGHALLRNKTVSLDDVKDMYESRRYRVNRLTESVIRKLRRL